MKYRLYAYYAYTAGVLDSDGCITIYKTTSGGKTPNPVYSIRVFVNQVTGQTVDFLVGFWGGNVRYRPDPRRNHHGQWVWSIHCSKAYEMLKKCLPFLRIKRKQAEIAIRFKEYKRRAHGKRLRLGHGKGTGPFPPKVYQRLEAYKQQMHELKKQIIPAKALATTNRDDASTEAK